MLNHFRGCRGGGGVPHHPPPEGAPQPPPPFVDPNPKGRRVGAVSRRGRWGGSVGTPTHIPQNDPRDTLIILNIHNIISGSHQPRSDPEAGLGSKCFFGGGSPIFVDSA